MARTDILMIGGWMPSVGLVEQQQPSAASPAQRPIASCCCWPRRQIAAAR